MLELDWSKTDVQHHPDSPWLTTPPTAAALAKFCPDAVFRPAEVRDTEKFAAEVASRTLFGHPKDVKPIKPNPKDFMYSDNELSRAPLPLEKTLTPPNFSPDDPKPTPNFLFPRSSVWTLKKSSAYQRGCVYTAPYWPKFKNTDRERMLRVEIPPQLYPEVQNGTYVHRPVPGCVQMTPGIPFAYEIDGDPNELHTIGAVHTFESLRHEPDFWEIYQDSVLVAKGLRGCRPPGNTDAVFPISHFPLKRNDRSPDLPPDSKEGSFNLASTLLKGVGPGVVVPAAQVDTAEFRGQCSTILSCLSRLRQRLLRKTVSKFELDVSAFNSQDMNVVGFGGLEPNNATSCQLNMSKIGKFLREALGLQGGLHPDSHDKTTQKTYFFLALCLPPGSDVGAFLLARAGLYIRELGTWCLHVFFDGVDIHSGIEATTTQSLDEFLKWVEEDLEPIWNRSELGRIGVVSYGSHPAFSRDAHMSMTPPVKFGNFGLDQNYRDFATYSEDIIGGQEAWANRMGWEALCGFWNSLQLCNLDLGMDLDVLAQSITFKNSAGQDVSLKKLPLHPVKQAEHIKLWRGYFAYLLQRCERMRIHITKHNFIDYRERLRKLGPSTTTGSNSLVMNWEARSSIHLNSGNEPRAPILLTDFAGSVVKILEYVQKSGQAYYRILTDESGDSIQFAHKDDPRLPESMLAHFWDSEIKKISSVPIVQSRPAFNASEDIDMDNTDLNAPPVILSGSSSSMTDTTAASGSQSANCANSFNVPEDSSAVCTHSGSKSKGKQKSVELVEDSEKYEVETILDLLQNKQGNWYLVKFVGSGEPDWTDWVHENDMSCKERLTEFYNSLAANSEPENTSQPPRKKARLDEQGKAKKSEPERPSAITLEDPKLLNHLLDFDRLTAELEAVKESRPKHNSASKFFFKALASPTLIRDILETSFIQTSTLSTLDMVVDSTRSKPLEIAAAQFAKLATSANTIAQGTAWQRATSLFSRILRWTNARSHIVIYRWCTATGPEMVQALFDLHRTCGFAAFEGSPALGLLVDHIVQFVCEKKTHYVEKERARKAQKRKISSRAPNLRVADSPSLKHGTFGPSSSDSSHVPGNLYGLIEIDGKKAVAPIALSYPGGDTTLSLYAACQTCLLNLFHKAVIMPALRSCNNIYPDTNSRNRNQDDDTVFNRAICRGAVLDCIATTFEDDGILSSNALDIIFYTPWLAFSVSRADRLGPAMLLRANIAFSSLKTWLESELAKSPATITVAKELGDEIHSALQEMLAGEPHPDTSAAHPSVPKTRKSGKRKVPIAHIYKRPKLEEIIGESAPNFSMPALILRETLNLQRHLPEGIPSLRRLLQGQHASRNTTTQRNLDHIDPRREFNVYTRLFQQHFPAAKLTRPMGLSNVLAWFGTGQGAGTEQFLDYLVPSGGFFAEDVDGMVAKFEEIISQNEATGNAIQYDNQKAWSQTPNQNLLLQPTKRERPKGGKTVTIHRRGNRGSAQEPVAPKEKYAIREKFVRMFDVAAVQDRWTNLLGAVANCDPADFSEDELPSWSATLNLVEGLKLPAFNDGLTPMQLVNTLAFSKVICLPTVVEMATWISRNPKLGAATGLKLLGFETSTRKQIEGAYICFHNVLDVNLTSDDQHLLGFHPPFTEHLLCKTPRWDRFLKDDDSLTLVEMGEQIKNQNVHFASGRNRTDAKAFPIPVSVSRTDLDTALKKTQDEQIDDEKEPPESEEEDESDNDDKAINKEIQPQDEEEGNECDEDDRNESNRQASIQLQ